MLVAAFDMQLHAAVTVDGRDRRRLERLCRYFLRPPFAQDAVQRTPDGNVRVTFKAPRRSGATYAEMTPDTFLARLCALVPPPRVHLIKYFGVLANRHALRPHIVPTCETFTPAPRQLAMFVPYGCREWSALRGPLRDDPLRAPAPSRLSWMQLLARVFHLDLVCPRCHAPLRVRRAVADPDELAAALHGPRGPPRPRPEPLGQLLMLAAT
jgi:hypothetical protein